MGGTYFGDEWQSFAGLGDLGFILGIREWIRPILKRVAVLRLAGVYYWDETNEVKPFPWCRARPGYVCLVGLVEALAYFNCTHSRYNFMHFVLILSPP